MPTNSKQHLSSVKTTTVYSGPGYPLDPAKEERRMLERGMEYCCERIRTPKPDTDVLNVMKMFEDPERLIYGRWKQ